MPFSKTYIGTMNSALSSPITLTQWVEFLKATSCITSQQSTVLVLNFQGQVFKDVLRKLVWG